MLYRRDYHVAAKQHVQGWDIVPIIEIGVTVTTGKAGLFSVATARPLGFAVLTPCQGYWLVFPQNLSDLAEALAQCVVQTQAS